MDVHGNDPLTTGSGSPATDEPAILDEIEVEDLSVDGICGVY